MSDLNKPTLKEMEQMPPEKKKQIVIIAILAIAFIVLLIFGVKMIGKQEPINTPEIQETIPTDVTFEKDNMHVAKSSWRDGAWCAVEKESVTAIHLVDEYAGDIATSWTVDEILFHQTSEGEIYIVVGEGIHMLGSMRSAFADFTNCKILDGLHYLETSNVTDMSMLFANSAMTDVDMSTWDTSRVTNFSKMFYDTYNLSNINISNLDLSNVVDASYMFAHAYGADNIYLENVDTSHILTMVGMFEDTASIANSGYSLIHGTIDTSSCTDMSYMFSTSRIENISDIVKSFDTSNVTNMQGMFYHGLNIYELDLSGWDVSKVTDMSEMFYDINLVWTINMAGWNPVNVTDTSHMFERCHNLRAFNQWISAPKVTNAESMFENCYEMRDLDVTCFDGNTFENAERMFYCVQYVEHIYSNGFTVTTPNYEMFKWDIALVGPTAYDETRIDHTMATTSGYLTPVNKGE